MALYVDEARTDDHVSGIDHLNCLRWRDVARGGDGGDAVTGEGHLPAVPGIAGAVDDPGAVDEYIELGHDGSGPVRTAWRPAVHPGTAACEGVAPTCEGAIF